MKRHQLILAVAAAAICLSTALARDTFELKETELRGFEVYQDEVLLTMTRPLYRLGQVLKVEGTDQYVVPLNYYFAKGQWHYLVAPVKVAERTK